MMRKTVCFICVLLLCGCGAQNVSAPPADAPDNIITVTDSMGHTLEVRPEPQTVIALSSSIAEIWLLAGGELSGVTSDAFGERPLDVPENITVLGTVKEPSTEGILALQPELVLLSEDIPSHMSIAETLKQSGIPYYAAKVETLAEYLKTLSDFTQITGDAESYAQNGERIESEVAALLSRITDEEQEKQISALFLRAYSTGVKPKAREHTVCTILEDIGVRNIALREGFPLEELSIEAVLEEEPDFIFVVAMGGEDAAIESIESSLLSNPAFAGLSAVQNDRLIILPKELYHFKPNNRWGEAYERILRIVYP